MIDPLNPPHDFDIKVYNHIENKFHDQCSKLSDVMEELSGKWSDGDEDTIGTMRKLLAEIVVCIEYEQRRLYMLEPDSEEI